MCYLIISNIINQCVCVSFGGDSISAVHIHRETEKHVCICVSYALFCNGVWVCADVCCDLV